MRRFRELLEASSQATANPTGWSELPYGRILKELDGEADYDQVRISLACLENAE